MTFTDLFIRRPVLALVVSLLIVLLGWQAFGQLPLRQFPQMESALVTVTTVSPGASAETVQSYITQPLQKSLASAQGIDYMRSTSRQNVSIISIYGRVGADSDRLFTELLAKTNEVRNQLPRDIEDPVLNKIAADNTALMYLGFFQRHHEQCANHRRPAACDPASPGDSAGHGRGPDHRQPKLCHAYLA